MLNLKIENLRKSNQLLMRYIKRLEGKLSDVDMFHPEFVFGFHRDDHGGRNIMVARRLV